MNASTDEMDEMDEREQMFVDLKCKFMDDNPGVEKYDTEFWEEVYQALPLKDEEEEDRNIIQEKAWRLQ